MRACITAIAAAVPGLVVGILFDRGPGIEYAALAPALAGTLAATLAGGIPRRGGRRGARRRGRGGEPGAVTGSDRRANSGA